MPHLGHFHLLEHVSELVGRLGDLLVLRLAALVGVVLPVGVLLDELLVGLVDERALAVAEEIATSGNETLARKASDALYHITSATLLAHEGAKLGAQGEDARRLILARMVIDHRLRPQDPLAIPQDEDPMAVALLAQRKVSLDEAQELVAG